MGQQDVAGNRERAASRKHTLAGSEQGAAAQETWQAAREHRVQGSPHAHQLEAAAVQQRKTMLWHVYVYLQAVVRSAAAPPPAWHQAAPCACRDTTRPAAVATSRR